MIFCERVRIIILEKCLAVWNSFRQRHECTQWTHLHLIFRRFPTERYLQHELKFLFWEYCNRGLNVRIYDNTVVIIVYWAIQIEAFKNLHYTELSVDVHVIVTYSLIKVMRWNNILTAVFDVSNFYFILTDAVLNISVSGQDQRHSLRTGFFFL